MDVSDSIDKSWDHPWTTEEMRKKRREWSLAGDVGLLKHLQQFSENLMSKANKTQAALDTLTTQLKETGILVDNVTNTSLALANTQFIESRVHEDDIEIKENSEEKQANMKTQDLAPENLLASISENVKQGLNIMDEKYKMMDVACSDSEDDDGGAIVVSVMVGPNDLYQDRPLPYVIGSDKWIASNKIGLESSSSESEQLDEENESESEKEEETRIQKVFNNRHSTELNIARLSSSSSSDSYNYNDASSNLPYMNNSKVDTISQNNVNSTSESVTPNNTSQISNNTTPNFAEELAKRLGTVHQAQKHVTVDEVNESSINRLKDDLFTSEKDNNDVFNDSSGNPFSDKKGFFDDQVSSNLWREKPITSYKSNIIPPSIDIPPPISIVSTKPKSAIDDLFADADSEEDSDDIFSSKNTAMKKHTKESSASDNAYLASAENIPKKFLDILMPGIASNVATSTPESRDNVSNLFGDDENDDGDLFSVRKQQSSKLSSASNKSINMKQESSKKKSIGDQPILGRVLSSDIEGKLSNRIMRQQSSDSFDNDALGGYDSMRSTKPESTERGILNNNIVADRSSVVIVENPVESISVITDNSNSSEISIPPPSMDNTAGSGLWGNFQPEMSSTRLKSEEIYREPITSDSLFAAQTRNSADFNSALVNANSNNQQQPRQEQHEQGTSSLLQDDVFENDDLFGPPPLPSKSDSKRVKSKVSSLFDDSDSGDELFSAASSGSRSQKSTDLLATAPLSDKIKSAAQGGGLFDDDMDIFGSKDCPDVDIFGTASKSRSRDTVSNGLFDNHSQESIAPNNNRLDKSQTTKMESKKIILFDDDNDNDDEDDGDLFGTKAKRKSSQKIDPLESENDLFLSTKTSNEACSLTKKDDTIKSKIYDSKDISTLNTKGESNNDLLENKLFSSTEKTHNLLFEDDDYDDLFGKKEIVIHENNWLSESREEDKKAPVEKMREFPKEDRSSAKPSKLAVKETAKSNVNSEKNKADVEKISNAEEDIDGTARKRPPKTLSIRTTTSPCEDGNQAPRKSVSGKIKNLMGKMGDLKILSPMDAPLLWRKSEEKDEDGDVVDRDSDNGCQGAAGRISPPSVSEDSTRKESSYSTISSGSNMEVAINFDDLAQVETLSTTASKSRVRIQAKRRPQSRHARKSALRHSGIDFDTADNVDDSQEENQHTGIFSHTSIKNSSSALTVGADRLSTNDNAQRTIDLTTDDKSELGSISKESSVSVNRNTLLSPSTDEEDLFDVPPDLPEDPQKEDALFGRAPILSPVNGKRSENITIAAEPPMNAIIRNVEVDVNVAEGKSNEQQNSSETTRLDQVDTKPDISSNNWEWSDEKCTQIANEQNEVKRDLGEEPNDPLRDSSHDPLKNPSQLFAFVTKTPSPDKGKGLLFSEDDSLFSNAKKSTDELPQKKKVLDLFADNTDADLFSAPLKKPVKKPLRDTNISLFDDDDNDNDDANVQNNEEDNLFGSTFSKARIDAQKSISVVQTGRRKNNIFDDDDEDDSSLFLESSSHSQKSDSASISEPKHDFTDFAKDSNKRDIFGETPCDDIFATRKVVPKKIISSRSLFESDDDDDDNDGHIFGKSSMSMDSKTGTTIASSKPVVKKLFTRDLKKTAERIAEDPLSLLQDD